MRKFSHIRKAEAVLGRCIELKFDLNLVISKMATIDVWKLIWAVVLVVGVVYVRGEVRFPSLAVSAQAIS